MSGFLSMYFSECYNLTFDPTRRRDSSEGPGYLWQLLEFCNYCDSRGLKLHQGDLPHRTMKCTCEYDTKLIIISHICN